MKRIYKGNDISFNLTMNTLPVNFNLIKSLEFRFYTQNKNQYILKTEADVDKYNVMTLSWQEMSKLESGVIFYDYHLRIQDPTQADGALDKVENQMTEYYLCNDNSGSIDIDTTDAEKINAIIDLKLQNYYTKEEVDNKIKEIPNSGTADLTNYYKKNEVYNKGEIDGKGYLTSHQNIDHLASKAEVERDFQKKGEYLTAKDIANKADKSEVYTISQIDSKHFLTEHQSLNGYAKESWVSQEISKAQLGGTDVDTSTLATKEELNLKADKTALENYQVKGDYVTNEVLNQKGYLTQHQDISGKADKTELSNYVTNSALEQKGYITEHQSLAEYAKKSDLTSKADKSELQGLATKEEIPSLVGYAKETWVTGEIEKAKLSGGDVDTSTLATKEELKAKLDVSVYNQEKATFATKDEIPSTEGFIKEIPSNYVTDEKLNQKGYLTEVPLEYVTETELNQKGYLTQHQNISGKLDKSAYEIDKATFVTDEKLTLKGYLTEHQDISMKADKSEIPSLTGYATEVYVGQEIAKAKLDGQVDTSTLATKEELKGYQVKGDYVTNTELNQKGYLTQHQSLVGYAKTSELPKNVSELTNDSGYITSIPSNYVTDEKLNQKGYLTQHQNISGKLDKSAYELDKPTFATKSELSGYLKEIPSEYVTDTELTQKGYLTEVPSNYVTNETLSGKNYATKDEIPSTSNFATKSELSGKLDSATYTEDKATFATKAELGNINTLLDTINGEVI